MLTLCRSAYRSPYQRYSCQKPDMGTKRRYKQAREGERKGRGCNIKIPPLFRWPQSPCRLWEKHEKWQTWFHYQGGCQSLQMGYPSWKGIFSLGTLHSARTCEGSISSLPLSHQMMPALRCAEGSHESRGPLFLKPQSAQSVTLYVEVLCVSLKVLPGGTPERRHVPAPARAWVLRAAPRAENTARPHQGALHQPGRKLLTSQPHKADGNLAVWRSPTPSPSWLNPFVSEC